MPENFAAQILGKSSSSRSLTDPVPEEEVKEELPSPQVMIDTLYQILMKRLDEIEEKIDCLKK